MKKLLVFCWLLLSFPAMGDNQAAQNLRAILDPIQSLSGKFAQYEFNDSETETRTLYGDFTLARPLNFFWEIAPPYSQTLVIDNEEIYIYDKDLHQVIIRPLDKNNLPPFFFLAGNEAILQSMDISQPVDDSSFFFLSYLDSSQSDEFFIQFKDGLPYELHWTNALGQKIIFIFSEMKSNLKLKKNQFKFRIPRGAEVIREQELSEDANQ